MQGVLSDVTELRRTKAALQMSEHQLRTVVDAAPVILFATDHQGVITISEGRGLTGLGFEPSQLVGRSLRSVDGAMEAIKDGLDAAMAGETVTDVVEFQDEVFEVVFSPGKGRHAVIGLATNITDRHRSEQELARAAYHDPVTGLLNRPGIGAQLAPAIERARKAKRSVALLCLDLPGKRALVRRIVQNPSVWKALRYFRERAHKPPFEHP